MVHVLADVVQIVVLAAGTDTLLRVGGTLVLGHVAVGVDGAEEDRLELVHTGVGEQERGVIERNGRGRVYVRVRVLLYEEVHVLGTHLFR